MILEMSAAEKEGEKACFAGLPLNKNPYLKKKGVIANLQRNAWERGFKNAEEQIRTEI